MPTPEITRRLTRLMEQERGGIYRLCMRHCGQSDAAEDLVQETFIEAWRNRHKLVEPTLSPGWLYKIARNVCLRWRRTRTGFASPGPNSRARAKPNRRGSR